MSPSTRRRPNASEFASHSFTWTLHLDISSTDGQHSIQQQHKAGEAQSLEQYWLSARCTCQQTTNHQNVVWLNATTYINASISTHRRRQPSYSVNSGDNLHKINDNEKIAQSYRHACRETNASQMTDTKTGTRKVNYSGSLKKAGVVCNFALENGCHYSMIHDRIMIQWYSTNSWHLHISSHSR